MKPTLRFFAPVVLAGGILLSPACGGIGGGQNLDPEPFVRERLDGKIPVKPELIRQQVRAVWDGTPEGEAEVLRWQQIETDYHACRLVMHNAKPAAEQVFADCMAGRGYVYMYRHDAEQLHNDIEFEMDKGRDDYLAAKRKAEEDRRAAAQKAEEERIAAAKKRQEEAERIRRQGELNAALVFALNAGTNVDIAEVKRLINGGADVKTKSNKGLTPLHIAAVHGQIQFALALVKAGADIDAKAEYDWTPLHFATANGQAKIALALIKAGADIEAKTEDDITPLHVAAGAGEIETMLILIRAGANIRAKSNDIGMPLHFAAAHGQAETALALVKAGVSIDSKDNDDWTALHWAVVKGQTKTALALIKAGADIDAKDNQGITPLHFAARYGYLETVIALIHSGAYLNATTNNGETPLDIARIFKQYRVIEILQNPPPPKPSGEQAPNVATAPAPEDSNVAERVFDKASRSVVYIEDNNGQGGGVIIAPNIVATNCHVVDSGGIVVYKANNRRTDKSRGYRATIRRRDNKRDFCLLDVSGLWGIPANVRRYDTLRIGESVYGIGAPQGLDLSLLTGVISQKRTEGGIRKIQTNVAISPGSSGGGLFDRKGNLVGILTSKLVDEEVEGIGFAIPADLAL